MAAVVVPRIFLFISTTARLPANEAGSNAMLKVIKQALTEFVSPSKVNTTEDKMEEEEEKLFRRPDGKPMIFTSTAVGKERVKVMYIEFD